MPFSGCEGGGGGGGFRFRAHGTPHPITQFWLHPCHAKPMIRMLGVGHCSCEGKDVFPLFIDTEKAFDWVDWELLGLRI